VEKCVLPKSTHPFQIYNLLQMQLEISNHTTTRKIFPCTSSTIQNIWDLCQVQDVHLWAQCFRLHSNSQFFF